MTTDQPLPSLPVITVNEPKPARRCLAGDVLNHEAALKLQFALNPTRFIRRGRYRYPILGFLQDATNNDLDSIRPKDVELSGARSKVRCLVFLRETRVELFVSG